MYIQSQYQVNSFDIAMNQVTVHIPFSVWIARELWRHVCGLGLGRMHLFPKIPVSLLSYL